MKIKKRYPTRGLCTMRVGGVCEVYAEIGDVTQLGHVLNRCEVARYKIIGNGSNIVFGDEYSGGIFRLTDDFCGVEICGDEVICGGGASLSRAFRVAMENSLSGLEELCHIPATVGGGVATSCGAFGRDIGEITKWVEIYIDGKIQRQNGGECGFEYRKNDIPKSGIITKVCFGLEKSNMTAIVNHSAQLAKSRRDTQPLEFPSAGSVFKRSGDIVPAKLIDLAGLKGYRVGGLEVSKKHAGFVVNVGDGTPSDFLKITADMKKVVKEKFGVEMKEEVEFVGESWGKK